MQRLSILSILLLFGGNVYAQGLLPQNWESEIELGIVTTRGNTDTQNINGKASVVNKRKNWTHTGKLEVLNNANSDTTTAERYFVSGKTAHNIDDRSYEFGLLTYESDRFSGYDYRATATIGYGYTVLKSDIQTLDLEIGAGIRESKLEDTGETNDEGLLRGAGVYSRKLSDHATLSEELTVEAGEDSTITKSITGLKSQVAGNLATKITLTVEHTSDVPDTVKHTDIETAVTLVFSL